MFCRSLPLLLLLPTFVLAQESVPGLKVPPGFVVTQYADHTLANDIYCMTVDAKGRIVVSGRGYVKILVDDDNDGKADRALDFADSPKDGAMGLLWEKDTLYVTGDGGLRRFVDKDGDGKADGPSELIRKMNTGGEHTSHAIRRGRDGWLYVLCGDGAGIDKSFATLPTSPIKDPVGGCVIRFTPDLKNSEIVAHGFRNAYGMDFSEQGNLFTYDSDNERCLSLPWYEPTRFYQVIDGGFYGWMAHQRGRFWRMPPYFLDVVPPVAYLGRGSPTGVVSYEQKQFPREYLGTMFALDWTFGKVYCLDADPLPGETLRKAAPRVFLEATGDNGFAPTSAVVHPETGDLFISVGGRGTRGAVYRVRHVEGFKTLHKRVDVTKLYEGSARDLATRSMEHGEEKWPLEPARIALRYPGEQKTESLEKFVLRNWTSHDHLLRQHTIEVLRLLWSRLSKEERLVLEKKADKPSSRLVFAAALTPVAPAQSLRILEPLLDRDLHPHISLGAIRVLQQAMGDLGGPWARGTFREGYSWRLDEPRISLTKDHREKLIRRLLALQGASPEIDWEVPRMAALLMPDDETLQERFVSTVLDEDPVRRVHLAFCFASIKHPTKRTSALIVRLALDAEKRLGAKGLSLESNGPPRLMEAVERVARSWDEASDWILKHPDFGEPAHLVFARIKGLPGRRAAEEFLRRIDANPDYALSPDIVRLLGDLPPKVIVPRARKWWSRPELRSALIPLLANAPIPEDQPRFVEGVRSGNRSLVAVSLEALNKLPMRTDENGREAFALLRGYSGFPEKHVSLRRGLLSRLVLITKQDFGDDIKAWRSWFRKTHPDLAAKLENPDGVDLAAWEKRLDKIAWDAGDATRGVKAFTKASCVQCHGGSASVGPDLAGATGRFSRADLFTAILRPSKDVADRYRTILVETKEGKTYQGLVIYDAIDSLILHTREGTTVRLLGGEIAERRQIDVSPMPAGLLEALSDGEIADLYAYLKGKK